MNEIETTWRVYRKEWIHRGTFLSEEKAQETLDQYSDRLPPEDLRVSDLTGDWQVFTRIWNVAAEWKRQSLAESWMGALIEEFDLDPGDLMVVERNSRAEVTLQNFGVLKLPTG